MDCPVCSSPERQPFHIDNGYAIDRCGSCGLLYVPTPPAVSDLKSMYDDERWRGADGSIVRQDDDYIRQGHDAEAREKLARLSSGSGRLLDIGCGTGDFVETARQMGFQAEGVELSSRRVDAARERGLQVYHGDVLDLDLKTEGYDVVICIDILSHVREPTRFLRRAAELLRPGGELLLETGNKAELSRPRDGTYLRDFWGAPGHLTFFGEAQLRRVLSSVGFQVVAVSRRPVVDLALSRTRLTTGKHRVIKRVLWYVPPLRWLLKSYVKSRNAGYPVSSSLTVRAVKRG